MGTAYVIAGSPQTILEGLERGMLVPITQTRPISGRRRTHAYFLMVEEASRLTANHLCRILSKYDGRSSTMMDGSENTKTSPSSHSGSSNVVRH